MFRIPFLTVHFQKGIPTMKTILTEVILAGLFAARVLPEARGDLVEGREV